MYVKICRNLAGGSARMAVSTISARAHSVDKRFSGVWPDTPVFLNRFCRNLAGGSARMAVYSHSPSCQSVFAASYIPTAPPARVGLQLHIFPQPLLPE